MSDTKTEQKTAEGLLDITDKGYGFLRSEKFNFAPRPADPYVKRETIVKYNLRPGLIIKGQTERGKGPGGSLTTIESLNDRDPEHYFEIPQFDEFTVVDPSEMIRLETGQEPLGPRIIDLLTPIGKGQRGLIVAPPRTGKTILLQQMAHGITTNHPEIKLIMLLIDERPEEVTDMRRNTKAEVVASSNDKGVESHVKTAKLTLEKAKRLTEFGENVVILLDSITRLGRAYNNWTKSSGRTMSGGLDIRALQLPKKFFGSARKNENGGSLTIISTALVDTGSRMDEVIFQEFKGTGNMELALDRDLANKRIYPAINIQESGTRKEELLIEHDDLEKIHRFRRHLDGMPVGQDVDMLIKAIKKHASNKTFLAEMP